MATSVKDLYHAYEAHKAQVEMEQALGKTISVRMSPRDISLVDIAAEKLEMSRASFVREALTASSYEILEIMGMSFEDVQAEIINRESV